MPAIKNRSPYICLVFSFRDNLTSLSINGFPVLNYANFGFAPQTQILIYIFFIYRNVTAIKNRRFFLCLVFSFRDNLTSLSINAFPGSNFANFGFDPQTQILIYNFLMYCNVTAIKI